MYTVLIKWRVNLASPLIFDRETSMNFNYPVHTWILVAIFVIPLALNPARPHVYVPYAFPSRLFYISRDPSRGFRVQKEIGGKVPLVSHRRQRHWRLARYVNSQLRIYRIVYTRLVSHPTISILWNIIVRGPSLAAAFLYGVNHLKLQNWNLFPLTFYIDIIIITVYTYQLWLILYVLIIDLNINVIHLSTVACNTITVHGLFQNWHHRRCMTDYRPQMLNWI